MCVWVWVCVCVCVCVCGCLWMLKKFNKSVLSIDIGSCSDIGPSFYSSPENCLDLILFFPKSFILINFYFVFMNKYLLNWRINKLLLPHTLYSGAKHMLSISQRPFHFHYSIGTILLCQDKHNTITKHLCNK